MDRRKRLLNSKEQRNTYLCCMYCGQVDDDKQVGSFEVDVT